jgi:hypothetical protein
LEKQNMARQSEFDFGAHPISGAASAADSEGLARWHTERAQELRELATKLGMPLGHQVEIRLKDGVVLRGRLQAGEVVSILESINHGKISFQVDGLVFSATEIEACVRLD